MTGIDQLITLYALSSTLRRTNRLKQHCVRHCYFLLNSEVNGPAQLQLRLLRPLPSKHLLLRRS